MTAFTATDHAMMARALRLAETRRLHHQAQPDGRLRDRAAATRSSAKAGTQRKGGPHAEVFALQAAGERARGATAYVTLEPCAHVGSTGPCADALIAAGVARVVAAMRDPFPQVDGAGFDKLRAAGIAVDIGLMEAQARAAQPRLPVAHRARPARGCGSSWRPASTAAARWPTAIRNGSAARPRARDVQQWRARAGAILTGAGTVLIDDPQLTVRLGDDTPFVPPLRVVLDPGLATVARGRVREGDAPTLYIHAPDARMPRGVEARSRARCPSTQAASTSTRCSSCSPSAGSTKCRSKPAPRWPARSSRRAWSTKCCCTSRRCCWASARGRCSTACTSTR